MHCRGNTKIILSAIVVVVLIVIFLVSVTKNNDQSDKDGDVVANDNNKKFLEIKVDDATLRAEVADTAEKRILGLSGRESLGEGEALVFLFDQPGKYGFWMKDMKFPIDILWLNHNDKIVGITKNADPNSFPEVFEPAEAVMTVIEMNAGWIEKHDIDFESVVSIPRE